MRGEKKSKSYVHRVEPFCAGTHAFWAKTVETRNAWLKLHAMSKVKKIKILFSLTRLLQASRKRSAWAATYFAAFEAAEMA